LPCFDGRKAEFQARDLPATRFRAVPFNLNAVFLPLAHPQLARVKTVAAPEDPIVVDLAPHAFMQEAHAKHFPELTHG
jgi:hypothetical protein